MSFKPYIQVGLAAGSDGGVAENNQRNIPIVHFIYGTNIYFQGK